MDYRCELLRMDLEVSASSKRARDRGGHPFSLLTGLALHHFSVPLFPYKRVTLKIRVIIVCGRVIVEVLIN